SRSAPPGRRTWTRRSGVFVSLRRAQPSARAGRQPVRHSAAPGGLEIYALDVDDVAFLEWSGEMRVQPLAVAPSHAASCFSVRRTACDEPGGAPFSIHRPFTRRMPALRSRTGSMRP